MKYTKFKTIQGQDRVIKQSEEKRDGNMKYK